MKCLMYILLVTSNERHKLQREYIPCFTFSTLGYLTNTERIIMENCGPKLNSPGTNKFNQILSAISEQTRGRRTTTPLLCFHSHTSLTRRIERGVGIRQEVPFC